MTRRRLKVILLVMLLMTVLLVPARAEIETIVRVWLRRLDVTDSLRIQVQGEYMLEGGSMRFGDGTVMDVVLRGDRLVLHSGPLAVVMGPSMKLVRCESEISGALRLAGNDGLYEGDLALDISEGVIRPILHIHVEDYLLGVVPYEMGDSFPLEALKAQAIAARTYALRKSGSSGAYDVEDTTNDQAYRGRNTYSPLSEQAVRETERLVGTYNGSLAQCFYSASNGGQTELGQHVWPTDDPNAYAYMDMRDDPYDYENEASSVKRFTLPKKPTDGAIAPALHAVLVHGLADQLKAQGLPTMADQVRFDEFVKVEALTPKYEEPSRLMTQMRFDVKLSVRDCLYRAPAITPVPTPAPSATPMPTPAPTATPAFSDYRAVDQVFSVTLPIFTTVEQAMGLSINVTQNELIQVVDIGDAYMIESRRFGHGVGMSQRGAQQMAEKYGMSCQDILAFYYPGLTIMQYTAQREPLPTIDMSVMATPAPTPSPTPRPTLMPVTHTKLKNGEYVAVVSNIDDDSSLNLRMEPSLSSDVLRRLYKNQKLIVMNATDDGWSHVRTDVIEGYVRSEYLQTAEEE